MDPAQPASDTSPADASASARPSWQSVGPDRGQAIVLGAPFDGTSGGHPHQARAPGLLRRSLGLADPGPEQGAELGVWDVGDVLAEPVDAKATLDRIEQAITQARGRLPGGAPVVVLGGEHTVSLAALRALQPGSVVSLDAHPDLWDHQHGRKLAQGTWLRRAAEATQARIVLPHARAARGGEREAIEDLAIATEVPDRLPEPVYLTIDVDVFDPQDAPAVVYPEPEGPPVEELLALVQHVASEHELAGIDLVEVNASGPGPTVELGARVLARAMAAAMG